MRSLLLLFAVFICESLQAGGTGTGGTPPSLQDGMWKLADTAFNLDELPKIYVDTDTFRRAAARLSRPEVQSTLLVVEGTEIEVRKLSSSLVNKSVTKEIKIAE